MDINKVVLLSVVCVAVTHIQGTLGFCNTTETPSINMCQTGTHSVGPGSYIYLDSAGGAPSFTKVECNCTLSFSGSGTLKIAYRSDQNLTDDCGLVNYTIVDRTWGCNSRRLSTTHKGSNNLTYIKAFDNVANWQSCLGLMSPSHTISVQCYPFRIYYAPDEVVNGQFGDWSNSSGCSMSCGTGTQTWVRRCDDPAPRNNGTECLAQNGTRTLIETEVRQCTLANCPVNGEWGQWLTTSPCSTTCGNGTEIQTRSCDSPAPQNGGTACLATNGETVLIETRTVPCFITACPVDGGYTDWSAWTACTKTCGGGSRGRSRTCTNPTPQNDGLPCNGSSSQTEDCNTNTCPVDGGWSLWSDWDTCSKSCGGGGYQSRNRTCNNPFPLFGGLECVGDSIDIQACGNTNCPINGGWGYWQAWSQCSETCGSGIQTRYRYCDNPNPQYGGNSCFGNYNETQNCDGYNCPVNGQWGDWSSWTTCSVSCASGTHSRYRDCNSPVPQNGGHYCNGNNFENKTCTNEPCPINGNWGPWSPFGSCSSSCGSGRVSRIRLCNSPAPGYGGQFCPGSSSEISTCHQGDCPVNGNWGLWSPWSICVITCGSGIISRIRACNNPSPSPEGAECPGESTEDKSCDKDPCPIDGGVGHWSPWSMCTASCDIGERSRLRFCDSPAPQYGGNNCSKLLSQTDVCNITSCPGTGTSQSSGISTPTSTSTTSTPSSTPTASATEPPETGAIRDKDEKSNIWAIVGGVIGGLLFLLLLLLLIICLCRRRRRKEVDEKRRPSTGPRSIRYLSHGDDVTVTENELYHYDGETPSHATNALFVGGIPETPNSPNYIPHFSTGTGDSYAVIVDSNRKKPKSKERPKLDTFNSQEDKGNTEANGDVRASADTVKLADNYNEDNLGRGVENPGYDDNYIAPYDSAEGETKPKTSTSSPSPYDYIDNAKLQRDDEDYENEKLAGDYATLPDDTEQNVADDTEESDRYKRFISSEPEESPDDDGYMKSPKRDKTFEFPDTN
ncbi:SCO-spondin-like isoform X2 [Mercenaria mercenaria]|uniref:SCO-spondin-like isoform X2 n=1 Tax=Mercenaria mercenaria TaxID=6596 RepID=UPI00234E9D55|nr:SCO-spondin-like isoform X2 [Mercenaria mercenaria]